MKSYQAEEKQPVQIKDVKKMLICQLGKLILNIKKKIRLNKHW